MKRDVVRSQNQHIQGHQGQWKHQLNPQQDLWHETRGGKLLERN